MIKMARSCQKVLKIGRNWCYHAEYSRVLNIITACFYSTLRKSQILPEVQKAAVLIALLEFTNPSVLIYLAAFFQEEKNGACERNEIRFIFRLPQSRLTDINWQHVIKRNDNNKLCIISIHVNISSFLS